MKHLIFFSGGKASYVAAKRVIKRYGRENTTLLFCDTKIEDADLYRFMADCETVLQHPVVKIADGRTPWEVYKDARYIGGSRGARCSIELKRELSRKWIAENCEPDTTLHFGIDFWEKERTVGIDRQWQQYKTDYPLMWKPWITSKDIDQVLQDDGIEVPRLYKLGFSHNNCGGFCVKAGQGHFANLLRVLPDKYAECEKLEQDVYDHIGSVHPFIKMTRNGVVEYLTMTQYKEYVQRGGQIEMFDNTGCGCFIGDL